MSDDSENKPKLRLSRDLKAEERAEAPVEKSEEPKPKPELKLDRSRVEQTSEWTKTFDPNDPFGDILGPGKKKGPPKRDPAEPKREPPPPALPSKPPPRIDDGSSAKLDETIGRLPKEPASHRAFPLASLVMILLLLLVIGGAGAGIWYLLRDGGGARPAEAETAEAETPPEETPSRGPIEKARETIAKVPVADVEALTATVEPERDAEPEGGAGPPAEPAPEPRPEATVDAVAVEPSPPAEAPAAPEVAPPPAPESSAPSLQKPVSDFLSAARIGAVRSGDTARVMLNGRNYNRGDEVDAATGLLFVGVQEGKLVFRDANGVYYVKSF